MAALTSFSVVTPSEVKFDGQAEIVVMPGAAGDFAALAGHAPMLTTLRPGILRATVHGQGESAMRRAAWAVDGGFAQVTADRVIVLTDVALSRDDVDAAAARAELKAAQESADSCKVRWAEIRLELADIP